MADHVVGPIERASFEVQVGAALRRRDPDRDYAILVAVTDHPHTRGYDVVSWTEGRDAGELAAAVTLTYVASRSADAESIAEALFRGREVVAEGAPAPFVSLP